jgi:hypothetical protein
LIISIFILEHTTNLEEYFANIHKLLDKNGLVLLQIPDIQANPYDFMIYDHVFHFSKQTIKSLLKKFNFKIVNISNNIIKKEITCLIKKNTKNIKISNQRNFSHSKKNVINSQIVLNKNLDTVKRSIKKNYKIIIFGTAISAH